MKNTVNSEGFWFSYIDALTVLASLFLILFIAFFAAETIRNKKIVEFVNAWDTAFDKLNALDAKPQVSFESGGWKINIAEELLFPHNSSYLTDNGQKFLGAIGNILYEFTRSSEIASSIRVVVGGHADTTGTDSYNFWLSDKRATRVTQKLKEIIPNINFDAIGYGEKYPKSTQRESRRITIVIQPISAHLLTEKQ